MFDLSGLTLLSFEICCTCNLKRDHAECPINKREYADDRYRLDVDVIVDTIRRARKIGFKGMVSFHYYNEPLSQLDKILKIIEEVTMKKCRYCGKELDSNLEFCSSECENSYRKIIEKDRHKIKYFISGIILGFLAMFYGVVSSRNCMIGSGIIVMGVTVVLLPFTTSETTALFGNKKARFIGRILGMILIAVGIWVGFI